MTPWYAELFRREGFGVRRIHAREIGSKIPIDRVRPSFLPPSFER